MPGQPRCSQRVVGAASMSESKNYMRRALTLARLAVGTSSPNPPVGAIVVKGDEDVGEGFTLPPGQSHAEIVALDRAGDRSRGASLYVTLEPCCIYGRTPPCTQHIIASGVAEVHVAAPDPNPRINGRGMAELKAAGILVHHGEGEEEARYLYEGFAKHINTGVPFVTAKFAMSLDGKIATHTGDSRWVTGEAARGQVQEMRRTCDAIMVGVNTVLKDDPLLTARDETGQPSARQPIRVIVDSRGRTPPGARLLKEPGHTVIAVTGPSPEGVQALEEAGGEVMELPSSAEGLVDIPALLRSLGARGVVNLLVEGGGTLLGSLFDLGVVDKVAAFVAPVVIGGQSAPSPVAGEGSRSLSQAMRLERVQVHQYGEDVLIVGYPPQGWSAGDMASPGSGE